MNLIHFLEKINTYITFLNKYIWFIKTLLISLSLISLIVWFYPFETYKDFWNISWILLLIVMFMRPLRDIFPKCKMITFLLKFRRELWILVWVFWIAHVVWFIQINEYTHFYDLFFDQYNWKYQFYKFWWMLAFIVSIPLLFTSNWFFTHLLWKYWKTLQRLSYFMFITVAVHIFLIKWELLPLLFVWIWAGLCIGAYFKNKKNILNTSTWPKWLCVPCGYIYDENIWDPDSGVLPGTRFEDIPENWLCPVCGVGKSDFILLEWDIKIHESKIISLDYLTPDTIELQLDLQKEVSYISWQFLTFVLKDTIWEFNRSYSIANKNWNIYTFLIKLKSDGRSGVLLKTKKIWDIIWYTSISWNFNLQNTSNTKVFIATGTWLAPIYSMLLNTPENISKKLYFWVAKFVDLFYIEKLKKIKNLEIKTCISQEEVEFCHFGRIDLSNENFEKDTEFYICWNPWVVESSKKVLNEKWFTQVYCEEF